VLFLQNPSPLKFDFKPRHLLRFGPCRFA
jgi:hypothetical protein